MLRLVVCLLIPCLHAFTGSDCGTDPHRAVTVNSFQLDVTSLNGTMNISGSIDIRKSIPALTVKLIIKKKIHIFNDAWITVPCVQRVGSCVYDGCSVIEHQLHGHDPEIRNFAQQIVDAFNATGSDYHCPFHRLTNLTISTSVNIPSMDPLPALLLGGDYIVRMEAINPKSHKQYGCATIRVSV